jgi:hypothetical protein
MDATLKIYPILEKHNWPKEDIQDFLEAMEAFVVKRSITPADIRETELRLLKEIELVKKEVSAINVRIVETKVEIIKWNMGAIFMAVGLFVAILKLFG